MGKRVKRTLHKGKKVGEAALSEILESAVFLMDFMTSSMPRKIMLANFEYASRPNSTKVALHRYVKKGYISKIGKKRSISFVFNSANRGKFFGKAVSLKFLKFQKKWDKSWKLVIYDIPERERKERIALKNFLKELGFGMVQQSCWVSPYDFRSQIYDYCLQRKILDYLCIYKGEFFAGKDVERLVKEAWPLESIKQEYKIIKKRLEYLIEDLETKDIPLKQRWENYADIYDSYKNVLRKDPFLPTRLLLDWPRESIDKLIRKLSKIIWIKPVVL